MSYLYNHCATIEIKPILETSLNLCHSLFVMDFRDKQYDYQENTTDNSNDLIGALNYLSHEAQENELEDIHMILDACTKLCLAAQYCSFRGQFG